MLESTVIKSRIDHHHKQLSTVNAKITLIQKQLDIEKRDVLDMVSAHAIIRYLERTVGLDIDGLKRQIIADHEPTIKNFMTCKIETINGTLVVKDGVVVTII